jgi:hypothetical protein
MDQQPSLANTVGARLGFRIPLVGDEFPSLLPHPLFANSGQWGKMSQAISMFLLLDVMVGGTRLWGAGAG